MFYLGALGVLPRRIRCERLHSRFHATGCARAHGDSVVNVNLIHDERAGQCRIFEQAGRRVRESQELELPTHHA